MHQRRILCALGCGVMLLSGAFAQNPRSVIVAERGQLWEKAVLRGTLEQTPLTTANTVMFLYGRAPVTGEVLFGKEEKNQIRLMLTDLRGNAEQDMGWEVLWAAWSPGGDSFIYYDNRGSLFQVQGTDRQRLADGVHAASFSPDGDRLALVRIPDLNPDGNGKGAGLWIYDMATGEEQPITDRYNHNLQFVGYGPRFLDDRRVLFLADDGPTPFWLADLGTGEVRPVQSPQPFPLPTTQLYFTADGRLMLYGSDRLDQSSRLVAAGLDGIESGSFAHVTVIGEGDPLGFTLDGQEFLATSEEGVFRLDLSALTMEKVAELPEEEESPVLGPPALYNVKHHGPMQVASWRPTSWFSHNNTRPFADGGPFRFDCLNFGRSGHRGTDMGANFGVRIDASINGTVNFVNRGCGRTDICQTTDTSCGGGFGNYPRVRHSNGAETYYAHQSTVIVNSGANVNCNTQLGRVGSTGNSTGCHLHFELRFVVGGTTRSIDLYAGGCNWTQQSLWVQFNHPFHCP